MHIHRRIGATATEVAAVLCVSAGITSAALAGLQCLLSAADRVDNVATERFKALSAVATESGYATTETNGPVVTFRKRTKAFPVERTN